MADFGITSEGVNVPRLVDFLDDMRDSFLADTGTDLDPTNPDNARDVIVRLIGYYAGILDELSQQQQAIVDILDPDAASGVQLQTLARIIGVLVLRATKSTVELTITGTVGTVLPERTAIAEGGGTGGVLATWVNTTTITIGGGGTATGIFESEVAGAVPAPAGTITGIKTPITGWDTVTNAAAASIGIDEETDAALRGRMRQARASRGGCGVPGIRSRILGLEFIQSCVIIANPDNEQATINGILMEPNSYLVVVLPAQLTITQQQQVLGVLYDSVLGTSLSLGTAVSGDVVNLEDGTSWPVSFDYGSDITIPISLTITTQMGSSVNAARTAINTAIQALLPLQLGQGIRQLEICQLVEATGQVATLDDPIIDGVNADFEPLITERVTAIDVTVNGVAA